MSNVKILSAVCLVATAIFTQAAWAASDGDIKNYCETYGTGHKHNCQTCIKNGGLWFDGQCQNSVPSDCVKETDLFKEEACAVCEVDNKGSWQNAQCFTLRYSAPTPNPRVLATPIPRATMVPAPRATAIPRVLYTPLPAKKF